MKTQPLAAGGESPLDGSRRRYHTKSLSTLLLRQETTILAVILALLALVLPSAILLLVLLGSGALPIAAIGPIDPAGAGAILWSLSGRFAATRLGRTAALFPILLGPRVLALVLSAGIGRTHRRGCRSFGRYAILLLRKRTACCRERNRSNCHQ